MSAVRCTVRVVMLLAPLVVASLGVTLLLRLALAITLGHSISLLAATVLGSGRSWSR